jgi:hypothetical protein
VLVPQLEIEPGTNTGPVQWLNENSGAVIAGLTVVLIGVTIYYAVANWRVVSVMRVDLKLKWQPYLSVHVDGIGSTRSTVVVRAHRAAAHIEAIRLTVGAGGKRDSVDIKAQGVGIPEGSDRGFSTNHADLGAPCNFWEAEIDYRDASGAFPYQIKVAQANANTVLIPRDR